MVKTPDEIKKGLECFSVNWIRLMQDECGECPYLKVDSDTEKSCQWGTMIIDARDCIQQLEAKVPKWISMEEEKPKEYEPVFVYVKHTPEYFSDWGVVMEDVWLGDGWDCNADTDVHEVTHWMHKPEPPEV